MSTTNNDGPGPAPGPTTKNQEKPWSYRPAKGDTKIREFLQQLLEKLKGPQQVMAYCVSKAMESGSGAADDEETLRRLRGQLEVLGAQKIKIEQIAKDTIDEQQEEINKLRIQLDAAGKSDTPAKYSEKAEEYLQRLIVKKKTDRHNAIDFCIQWTKENKLFL